MGPISVALLSKVYDCGRLIAGIPVSNLAEGMDVRLFFCVCCVDSDLCEELITYLEESYRLCVFQLCVI